MIKNLLFSWAALSVQKHSAPIFRTNMSEPKSISPSKMKQFSHVFTVLPFTSSSSTVVLLLSDDSWRPETESHTGFEHSNTDTCDEYTWRQTSGGELKMLVLSSRNTKPAGGYDAVLQREPINGNKIHKKKTHKAKQEQNPHFINAVNVLMPHNHNICGGGES